MKKSVAIIIAFLLVGCPLWAQNKESSSPQIVNDPPMAFPGGVQALQHFILGNIKVSYSDLNELEKTTKSVVRFFVKANGRVDKDSIKVVRSCGNVNLDLAAIKVVSKIPRFVPAEKGAWMIIPITYSSPRERALDLNKQMLQRK